VRSGDKLFVPRTPEAVAPELKFRSLSVGYEVACGLTDSGAVHCWGDNVYGQLGTGVAGPYRLIPDAAVFGGHKFQKVVSGYQRACGSTADGASYCWGRNDFGQLGDGTTT